MGLSLIPDGTYMDAFSGKTGAEAAERAAQMQAKTGKDAIEFQKSALKTIRRDLNPFKQAGMAQLDGLGSLINDPNAQLNYVQNNPFFNALAGQARDQLFASQAARGRLGSGGTLGALQDRLLLMGNDLVNQNIGQRFNLAAMGQNAAAQQGTMTQNSGNSISDLITGIGNAQAAGGIGAANALGQGAGNMASAASAIAGIFLSDRRMKCNLVRVGELKNGIPLYEYEYVGTPQKVVGVMAQDVEPIFPSAVCDVFGVKFVDYSELARMLH